MNLKDLGRRATEALQETIERDVLPWFDEREPEDPRERVFIAPPAGVTDITEGERYGMVRQARAWAGELRREADRIESIASLWEGRG